jgi:KTSC domain
MPDLHIVPKIKRIPVDSTSIASIGYAPEQRILDIEFRESHEVYRYYEVSADEYEEFLQAPSKGTYLNRVFKPAGHLYQRIA